MRKKAAKPPKLPPGRPTKLTPAFASQLCKVIVKIGYPGVAAETLGVHRTTVYRWMDDNPDFAADVAQAKAKYMARELPKSKNIEWKLERLDPETFGRKSPDTVVNVTQTTQVLSREDALKELRELAKSDPDVAKLIEGESESQ